MGGKVARPERKACVVFEENRQGLVVVHLKVAAMFDGLIHLGPNKLLPKSRLKYKGQLSPDKGATFITLI